jgi:integrase
VKVSSKRVASNSCFEFGIQKNTLPNEIAETNYRNKSVLATWVIRYSGNRLFHNGIPFLCRLQTKKGEGKIGSRHYLLMLSRRQSQGMKKRIEKCFFDQQTAIPNLSPHDCRRSYADRAARSGATLDALMQAGGWSNYQTPLGYLKRRSISNDGNIL